MQQAAAYIRVSDERQDEYSPDSQLKLIRSFAQKQGDHIPEELVFFDDGISAKSAQNRTNFNRMIALAKEKEPAFRCIYVWKFSRFARNQEESLVYKNLLRKKGVSVVSVSEPIPDGPWGALIERIIEWMDEYYLINLSVEVRRGMAEKASRGEAMANEYGYFREGKCYRVNEMEANIVREIFERYASGAGMREIARELGDRGIRTIRGNPPDNRWVEYLLNNPVYIGKIRWSANGRVASARDFQAANLHLTDGLHPAILPDALWNAVQERLMKKHQRSVPFQRTAEDAEWMLKGLVRCGNCGATLVRQSAHSSSMQCHNYARGGKCQISHSLSIAKANRVFLSLFEQNLPNFSIKISPKICATESNRTEERKAKIKQLQKRLARCKEAYLAGADTVQEYAENKAKLSAEIQALLQLETVSPPPQPPLPKKQEISLFDLLRSEWVSEAAKNLLIRNLVQKIVYQKESGDFQVFFHAF